MLRLAATCIVIPVPEAEPLVGLLRRSHTRDGAEGMPAHITLIYPFTDDSVLTDGRIQVARTVFGRFSQFPFRLGSVGWFRNEAESHLYLAPEPPDPFVELVAALEAPSPSTRHSPASSTRSSHI